LYYYALIGLAVGQFVLIVLLGQKLSSSNRRLLDAEGHLEQAIQVKTDFLSNVSHELRTPMTGIKGYVDNMLDGIAGDITEKQARYLARVKVNADRLTGLINDLLDLSRLDRGRPDLLEIGIAEFDISDLVEELGSDLQDRVKQKGLDLRIESKVFSAFADRARVRQVLDQLCDNAIKFTENGEINISATDGDPGFVHVRVQDTGPGVAVDQRERIFDRFYQIQDEQSLTPGSGLGLSIAKEFTEIMGGHIWVEPNQPKGSAFVLALPSSDPDHLMATEGV
jgi:signal transduction histidine kinase